MKYICCTLLALIVGTVLNINFPLWVWFIPCIGYVSGWLGGSIIVWLSKKT